MKYYKTLQTAAKLPEYHLDYDKSQDELVKVLENIGYKKSIDFKVINERGYSTKAAIRFVKSKIKKDTEALDLIKYFLISEEKFNSLEDKMYYCTITKAEAQEI